MSRGPWRPETRAMRHLGKIEVGPHDPPTEPWKDTRVAARAKAKAATEAAREGAIAALAHKSRSDAKARGATRYIGAPCERHGVVERYAASGMCVFCSAEWVAARRGMPRAFGKVRVVPYLRPHMMHRPMRFVEKTATATPVLELDDEE